jgi:hypothetical protein
LGFDLPHESIKIPFMLTNSFCACQTVELLHHPPCPPIGPPHDKCVASRQEVTEYSTESSSAESSSSSSSAGLENGGAIPSGLSRFQWFMLVAAAAAVAMALFAIVAGQRRQEKPPHVLQGAVARRMALFSNFCDSTLCDASSGSVSRPSRMVEMTMSMDDYNDTLIDSEQNGPKGSAMV